MKYQFRSLWQAAVCSALLLTASGCDVLDQQPPNSFTLEQIFSSPDRLDKAATGMYESMQNANFLGGRALIYGDVRSDDVEVSPYFSSLPLLTLSVDNGYSTGAWQGGYRSMYEANFMLRELGRQNTSSIPADKVAQYAGEAKFVRALCHFTLVNLFAQPYNYTADASHLGIAIQLTAPDGTQAFEAPALLPRSTVKQVYDQIIQDLTEAIPALPDAYSDSDMGIARATADAARGLLSRVYLYKGDYDNAQRLAGQVIMGGRHTLVDDPVTQWLGDPATGDQPIAHNNESIFCIAMNQQDNPNTDFALGQHYFRGDVNIKLWRDTLVSANGADRRLGLARRASASTYYLRKYGTGPLNSIPVSNRGAYVPIVRYPEVLLNYAEGLARKSTAATLDTTSQDFQNALSALNQIRIRSTSDTPANRYYGKSFASRKAFLNTILAQRRFELVGEGHRLYDLYRNHRDIPAKFSPGTTTVVIGVVPWGSARAILPIPSTDLQRNRNLVQNPGY